MKALFGYSSAWSIIFTQSLLLGMLRIILLDVVCYTQGTNILEHAREQEGSYYISISQLFANKTLLSMARKKDEVQQMASLKLVVYYA